MENILEHTLADIVRQHHATASVFEKYHLDYCCQGKRTLAEACAAGNVPAENIITALQKAMAGPEAPAVDEEDPIQLIGYILAKHHSYVRRATPAIQEHLGKVVKKHGDRYPYMAAAKALFDETAEDLADHMRKEEIILFARIQEVYHLHENQRIPSGFIAAPAEVMEAEHQSAGNNLHQIRLLTNNYTPPADACTTHQVVLQELKAFEEDLHQHVHLENNVLFPLAQRMVEERQAVVA